MVIMNRFSILFGFIASLLFAIQSTSAEQPVMVGYFAEWDVYDRNYHVTDIPADKLTHVIYGFANISPEGQVELFDKYAATEKFYAGDSWNESLRGSFKQLQMLKKKHPHLKTLIAIGGWTLSDPFTDVALTPKDRTKFALSAVNFMHQYGFDGIDMDWEFPAGGGIAKGRPEDRQNFTLLIAELRNQLNQLEEQTSKKYLLTVASAAGDQLHHYELDEVAKYIDWYNLMAYDFHGSWENITNHQSALRTNPADPSPVGARYNVEFAVRSYIDAGVAPNKIALGIPLYSRGWAGVNVDQLGLFQKASGVAKGTWEPGILDYKDIHKKVKNNPEQYLVFWDEDAKVSWIFNPHQESGAFYTYEDVKTVKEKADFIKSQHLRGAMFWEISADINSPDNPDSIINHVHQCLSS